MTLTKETIAELRAALAARKALETAEVNVVFLGDLMGNALARTSSGRRCNCEDQKK